MENTWAVEDAHGTCVAEGITQATARSRATELNNQARERLGAEYERTRDGFYARDYSASEDE